MALHIAHDTIPAARIQRRTHQLTFGELFVKDSNDQPTVFNSTLSDRSQSTLKYRIPDHQRWPQWSKAAKQKFIDTIFKNYTMSGIILSQHVDQVTHCIYYNFEDGQTRASIAQDYYNNGFKYCGRFFSELTHSQQRRFENYRFTIEIIDEADDEDIHEQFERLQEGTSLKNSDKFWNRKETPIVTFALELIGSENWRHMYMGTHGFSSKKRTRLADVVGLIASLICENGVNYITPSFRRLFPILHTAITVENRAKVLHFLPFYFTICDNIYEMLPLREWEDDAGNIKKERMKSYWNLGKELGMIIWDYLDTNGETNFVKQARWIEIINIARTVPHFMDGAKTLWNGLGSANAQNALAEDIATRVHRVRAFSNVDTRDTFCQLYHIVWQNEEEEEEEDDDEHPAAQMNLIAASPPIN